MRKGICVAGNLVVDITYPIERWPRQSELTTITEGITRSVGGAVCNVVTDLARMDKSLPLSALGVIGQDVEGDFILEQLGKYRNVDLSLLGRKGVTTEQRPEPFFSTGAQTLFLMRVLSTGRK